ncbi:MAG: hypothetical protein JWL65_3762 [Gammaproteobacteria bacterium]|nr:hypothetical protein [Gammaproteobacteria bacterium]
MSDLELTALPGLPAYGEQARVFSATGMGTHSEGFVVGFKSAVGRVWTANFIRGLTKFDLLTLHPNAHDALIIAGGQVYIIDPVAEKLVEAFGGAIVDAFAHPTCAALVLNHQNLRFEAIGTNGRIWLSRRISWDRLRSLKRQGTILTGEAWRPDSTWHAFELNLDTGMVIGGSYDDATHQPKGAVNAALPGAPKS